MTICLYLFFYSHHVTIIISIVIVTEIDANTLLIFFKLFYDGWPYHTETSPLICRANQWTSFYMIGTSVMKELRYALIKSSFCPIFFLLWEFSLVVTLLGSQGKQSFLVVLCYPYHVLLDLFLSPIFNLTLYGNWQIT